MALIDQVCTKTFMKDVLGFDQGIVDISNFIVSGHSFGGITALGATCEDVRIKACCVLDPWFFPHYMELQEGKFGIRTKDQATCMIVTEGFYKDKPLQYALHNDAHINKYDQGPKNYHKFLENSKNKDKQAYYTLNGASHAN